MDCFSLLFRFDFALIIGMEFYCKLEKITAIFNISFGVVYILKVLQKIDLMILRWNYKYIATQIYVLQKILKRRSDIDKDYFMDYH
jgi:hypothetical protein